MANDMGGMEKPEKEDGGERGEAAKPFLRERTKRRPWNRERLMRRTLTTALMAVLFGGVASVTFLSLQPYLSAHLSPEEPAVPNAVRFVEVSETEEMSPEEMLAEYMALEAQLAAEGGEDAAEEPEMPVELPLSDEQVESILSRVVFDRDNYREMYFSLSSFVRPLNRTVVTISAIRSDLDWLNTIQERSRQSSGVIIAENGVELLILADYEPLSDAEHLELTFHTNETHSAELLELDPNTNLAILAVSLEELSDSLREEPPIATLGSSAYAPAGTPVIALGSPMGTSGSVGYGMVSATKSRISQIDAADMLLQTDIPGSSLASGVLFNLQGQVIGIITNAEKSADVGNLIAGYAISEIKTRIEKMANGLKLGYLGITGADVPSTAQSELGVPQGAYVQKTEMNSPAMLAGIQTGDVIVEMDGENIAGYSGYVTALQEREVGDTVTLTLMRRSQDEYKSYTVEMTIEARN